MARRLASPLLVASAFVALAFAGCLEAPAETALEATSADAASGATWDGLRTYVDTPDLAPRRSAAEREAAVVAPGDPRYAAFDALMTDFMASHEIPAATVAVLRDGHLRYAQGYGFLDENATKATPPDAMMRIASITKPMTAAVIGMLVEQGLLAYDDRVFCLSAERSPGCLLAIPPHPARPVQDARVADITVDDLVRHRTGWSRGPCTDPLVSDVQVQIAGEFGTESPPPRWRLAQWFMGTPMQFDPGTAPDGIDNYCNMGYLLLGLIAEQVSGATMSALYDAYLFRPLEIVGDIEPGRTHVADRNPREPFYACDGPDARDAYDPTRYGCASETLLPLEPALSVGGLIATADAVGAVYEVFANDGSVREPGLATQSGHTGGLPGTATTARRLSVGGEAGVDLQAVVLFNKATGRDALPVDAVYEYQQLHATLLAAFVAAEGVAG